MAIICRFLLSLQIIYKSNIKLRVWYHFKSVHNSWKLPWKSKYSVLNVWFLMVGNFYVPPKIQTVDCLPKCCCVMQTQLKTVKGNTSWNAKWAKKWEFEVNLKSHENRNFIKKDMTVYIKILSWETANLWVNGIKYSRRKMKILNQFKTYSDE